MKHFSEDSKEVMGLSKYLLVAEDGNEAVLLEGLRTFIEHIKTMNAIKPISLFKTAKYCHNCGTEQVQTEDN